jgi:ribosome-binding factor A
MSTRTQKVEEMLRRAVAEVFIRGELRDPRIQPASLLAVTAVRVSPDLGSARIFVDVLDAAKDPAVVIEALNSGAAAVRKRIGERIHLKRTPALRFEQDVSIPRAARIEQVLQELTGTPVAAAPADAGAGPAEPPEAAGSELAAAADEVGRGEG